jgi:uncharacterized protein YndB with AHSA1/START domain
MYEIRVTERIHAAREQVFDAIADYEHFFRGPDFEYSRVTVEGKEDRNGLGAFREISVNGMVFTEEIVHFERPSRLDYIVRKLVYSSGKAVPLRHQGGRMQLIETGDGTQIDWMSRFEITTPLVGWLVERLTGPRTARGFRMLLAQAKAELERPTGELAPP